MSGEAFAAALARREPRWDSPPRRDWLVAAWNEACARWPGITPSPEALADHLLALVPAQADPIEAIERLAIADLFIALACAQGDSDAIAAFERRFADAMASAARGSDEARRGELLQLLRHKLFVGEHPRIREYAGRGSLEGWVRVTARRTFLDMERGAGRRRDAPARDEALFERAAGGDLELDFLKRHYRERFATAFGEALSGLSTRDRNVLRQHLVHHLGIDELGALYDVHRATAARWVQRARGALLAGTRARMQASLRIEDEELDSIMRLIDSRLEVSVVRRLGTADES